MRGDEADSFSERFSDPPNAWEIMQTLDRRGALIAIAGERASGKTTLLRFLERSCREVQTPAIALSPSTAENLYDAFRRTIFRHENPRDQVVLIDDAHEWEAAQVTDVLMLAWELGTSVVFAAGVGTLLEEIGRIAPGLRERVTVFYLGAWNQADILDLLHESIGEKLSDADMLEIASRANGLPGLAISLAEQRIASTQVTGEPSPHLVIHPPRPLELVIEPGDATADDLARLYAALSDIYRAYGGSGLVFDPEANSVDAQAGWIA